MTISSVKTGTIGDSLLAGNAFFVPSSFESIATITGTGSATSITFSSIPSTYRHLQIRVIGRTPDALTTSTAFMRFNSDTGTNYAAHWLYGDGASATATGSATRSNVWVQLYYPGSSYSSSIHATSIIDIHDYAVTTKNKTVRTFNGVDVNASGGYVNLVSGLWMNTNAINSITIDFNGQNISNTSVFSLYGIKGA
jgi:hypothetical protein